jgi:hypothetical protein
MAFSDEKIMFQIYREGSYNRRYRVVYFTELTERNKEAEINRALAGEHFYDGFILEFRKAEAKAIIQEVIDRLNDGEPVAPEELASRLQAFTPR